MNSKAKSKVKKADDVRFSIPALRAVCIENFNCSTAIFDGAMYGVNSELSISEAETLINKFKNKKLGGN